MRSKYSVGVIALSIMTLSSQAVQLPEPGFPQSFGMQLKTHNFNIATLDAVHAAGFTTVRRGFYWNWVETEKGTYDFSRYDTEMAHAKELGLTVLGVFFSSHKSYEDDGLGGIQTEEGRRGFAAFAAALAEHYKDHDVIWEIWNEPNVRTFWRKDGKHNSPEFAEEYTALVKEVMPAILKANPDAIVLAGSVSNYWPPSYEWTESCFKLGILETGIAGWSVHPYGVKTPEEFSIGHKITRDLLKKYGAPDMPMVNTERGFAVKETRDGWSGGSKDRALEFQGWHFVRQFIVDQLNGILFTIWYEWDGDEFGLVERADGSPRPVFHDAMEMMEQLNGFRLKGRLPTDSDLDYVVEFVNDEGTRRLVAWTAPPPKLPPDEYVEHDLFLPILNPSEGAITDSQGKPLAVNKGQVTLTLTGKPIYLTAAADLQIGKGIAGPAKEKPKSPTTSTGEEIPLNLFAEGRPWTFIKNTGDGTFDLMVDGHQVAIGALTFDFTQSKSQRTPYVMAKTDVTIAEGATALQLHARSETAQSLTFRVLDSTGQTHQYKKAMRPTGRWEEITIPLTRRLEHWGGAKDGVIHFPIQSISFSVPQPGDQKTGQVEYRDATLLMP